VEHGFPIAVSETLAHAEELVPAIVELEHEQVGVIAVEARMLAGELQQEEPPLIASSRLRVERR
jgi:hypothetical protein